MDFYARTYVCMQLGSGYKGRLYIMSHWSQALTSYFLSLIIEDLLTSLIPEPTLHNIHLNC